MSPTTASIAIATCGLLGGALGYLVGHGSPDREPPETPRSAAAGADETGSAERWSPVELTAPVEPQSLGGEAATALQVSLEALEAEGAFAAILAVAAIEDPVARRDAFMELIARLDAEQLREIVFGLESALTSGDEAAMAKLEPLFDDFGDALMLFDRWAELDAAGVREFVSAPKAGDSDDEFMLFRAISLAFLARRDPDGAKAIAEAALGQDAYANFGMELQ